MGEINPTGDHLRGGGNLHGLRISLGGIVNLYDGCIELYIAKYAIVEELFS